MSETAIRKLLAAVHEHATRSEQMLSQGHPVLAFYAAREAMAASDLATKLLVQVARMDAGPVASC